MNLKVLVVTPWFPNRPKEQAGNFMLHSAEALLKAAVDVTVLVTRPWTPQIFGRLHDDWVRSPLDSESFDPKLNVQVVHFPSLPRARFNELSGPLFRLGTRRTVLGLIRATSTQVLHAHTEIVGYGLTPVARDVGIPLVISLHGINTEPRMLNSAWKRVRLRDALCSAARVVLVGEPLRGYFAPLAGRFDHFRVVPNGFLLHEETQCAASRPWDDVLRFISVSNLHKEKGIDLNLRAFAKLRDAGFENWVYSIIGGGDEQARLEKMSDELGMRDKVRFYGRLSHDTVLQLVKDAHVFVLPSYQEAFGIAYLEAMGYGLLTVGVSGQGPEAFITHRKTGLLVKPNDVDSLFRMIKSIFENRLEMQRIAAVGKRFVHSEFTWARHAEKLITVYREALSG